MRGQVNDFLWKSLTCQIIIENGYLIALYYFNLFAGFNGFILKNRIIKSRPTGRSL